ncbi:hypothetical protein TREES_T100017109 [Tupaia chinensis]|uniref:Uncharacterized protein n=1 Tax=Tupaia chinensis TaxID=246437 RepID=L9KQN2_TUPCH|nr:hypothetical protein TREES_T100017109 [Tupaia chinensis]
MESLQTSQKKAFSLGFFPERHARVEEDRAEDSVLCETLTGLVVVAVGVLELEVPLAQLSPGTLCGDN